MRVLARAFGLGLVVVAGAQAQAPGAARSDTADARRPDSTAVRVLPELTARTALPAARTRVPPAGADVAVDPALVRTTPAQNAWDLLRRTAGIEIREQGQGPGFASNAILRGFTSDHSSDVLMVIDGMPVNLGANGHTEGYADWNLLLPATVRALTVRHGPTDARFGDFALGGVVEVETSADVDGTAGQALGSSFGDGSGWLQAGSRGARGGTAVTAALRRDVGWRDRAGVRMGQAMLRGWRAVGSGRLDASIGLYRATWESPGFVDTVRFATRSFSALRAPFDDTDGGDGWRVFATARWTGTIAPSLVLRAGAWGQGLSQRTFLNIPGGPVLRQTEEYERRALAGGTVELGRPLGSGVLEAAVQGRVDGGRFSNTRTDRRTALLAVDDLDFGYQSAAAYLRWRGEPIGRVRVDAALRGDLLRYQSTDRLLGTPTATGTHRVLSPKLGVDAHLAGPLHLHGSLSRGFRGAPGVLFAPSSAPVTAWAGEAGLAYRTARIDAEVSVFRYDLRNEKIQDPITLLVSTAGASRRQGVDLRVTASPSGGIALRGHLTVNDAVITAPATFGTTRPTLLALSASSGVAEVTERLSHDDGGLVPGARVPGVASYFGSVGADVPLTPRLLLRTTGRFSGPFVPFREAAVETPAWLTADAGLSWQLPGREVALDVDLQNLADALYTEIRASGFLNPGTPRVLRVGLRFGPGALTGAS
jgi:hypothetical protein